MKPTVPIDKTLTLTGFRAPSRTQSPRHTDGRDRQDPLPARLPAGFVPNVVQPVLSHMFHASMHGRCPGARARTRGLAVGRSHPPLSYCPQLPRDVPHGGLQEGKSPVSMPTRRVSPGTVLTPGRVGSSPGQPVDCSPAPHHLPRSGANSRDPLRAHTSLRLPGAQKRLKIHAIFREPSKDSSQEWISK